jgi:hypothetical protein
MFAIKSGSPRHERKTGTGNASFAVACTRFSQLLSPNCFSHLFVWSMLRILRRYRRNLQSYILEKRDTHREKTALNVPISLKADFELNEVQQNRLIESFFRKGRGETCFLQKNGFPQN